MVSSNIESCVRSIPATFLCTNAAAKVDSDRFSFKISLPSFTDTLCIRGRRHSIFIFLSGLCPLIR